MDFLGNSEEFFKLSRISKDELFEKLKESAELQHKGDLGMLKLENVMSSVCRIVRERQGIAMDEIKKNLENPETVKRIEEWLDDLRMNGINHPELKIVCSRFLTRALRGELTDARQEYPSLADSKKKLMEYLS